jgi:hypothetical protein
MFRFWRAGVERILGKGHALVPGLPPEQRTQPPVADGKSIHPSTRR